MAFTVDTTEAPKKYVYQRYPLVMHKGKHPKIQSRQVETDDEEKTAAADGWSTERPKAPVVDEEIAGLTIEERVAVLEEKLVALLNALEEKFAALEASAEPKRKPKGE